MRRALLLALALLLVVPSTVLSHWPTKGRVTQWFTRSHRGVDIAAPRGTSIRPIAPGTVVYAGWRNNCGGWQVWIRHDTVYSAYYHMSRQPPVTKGAAVTTSTRIGLIGATGCSTGPHVHVEVWKGYPWRAGSVRVNPRPYFADSTRSTSSRTEALRGTPPPPPAPISWRHGHWLRL